MPYNAPTYFPPAYFAPLSVTSPASPAGSGSPYFAPTYFPAAYFYESTVPTVPTVPTSPAGNSPYFAPTYFPAAYFYESTVPTVPTSPVGNSPYFAPTYFASGYFYESTSPVVVPTPNPVPNPAPAVTPNVSIARDKGPYASLQSLLAGTGAFEAVLFGEQVQRNQAGAGLYPLAIITPKGWEETDDVDPLLYLRRVEFVIALVVLSQDGSPQFDQLDFLAGLVQNAVDGSILDGSCLPPLTKIRAGRYGQGTRYPEQSVELEGQFAFLIDPQAAAAASTS
jgi:hypothetical protein